jgi:hypothetical protein
MGLNHLPIPCPEGFPRGRFGAVTAGLGVTAFDPR